MKRIVVKIGSRVLTKLDGHLNGDVIQSLVKDVHTVRNDFNVETILVSSGAVASGRAIYRDTPLTVKAQNLKYSKEILKDQVLAAIGQATLIARYKEEFNKYHTHCAQILTTRKDFAGKEEYVSLKTVVENLLEAGVCPIINENDVLSPEELDFSDNDQLAYMVAAMVGADHLIILTNVDGVYNNNPLQKDAKVIPLIEDVAQYLSLVDDSQSTGKGGMRSKLLSADLITSLGIPMYIANGLRDGVLYTLVSGNAAGIGTFFPSQYRKKKNLKNWLATAAVGTGRIIVSTYLADLLHKKSPTSILFSGIEKIEGTFNEKDVVDVCDIDKHILARGLVKYSSEDLRHRVNQFAQFYTGKRSIKSSDIIAIHYDYMAMM